MKTADEIFEKKAKEERQEKIKDIGEVLTGVTKKFIEDMENFENGRKTKSPYEEWLRYFALFLLIILTIDFLFGSAWLIKSAIKGIF